MFLESIVSACDSRRPVDAPLSAPLGTLGRFYRVLLFGAAACLSVAILAVGCLEIGHGIHAHFSDDQFEPARAALVQDIEDKKARLRRDVINAEFGWRRHKEASDALMALFVKHGIISLRTPGGAVDRLLVANRAEDIPASLLSRYLAFAQTQEFLTTPSSLYPGEELSGYMINPQRTFAALMFGTDSVAYGQLTAAPSQQVFARLASGIVVPGIAPTRAITWIAPQPDPLSGKPVIRLSAPVFAGDRTVMIFVMNLSLDSLFARLRDVSGQGTFLVADRSGQVLARLRPPSGSSAGSRVLSGQMRVGVANEISMRADMLTISAPLADTGWYLVYVCPWQTVLGEVWPLAVGTLALLIGLWFFVIVFYRGVFNPLFAQSCRFLEGEHLNRTLIGLIPVGLCMLACDSGRVVLANDAMRAYARDINISLENLARILARHCGAELARADRPAQPLQDRDMTVELPGGGSRDLSASFAYIRYLGTSMFLCSFVDISMRRDLERTLDSARISAEEANRAKSTFLATMSHEIRTPLSAVLGNLELLEHSVLSDLQRDRLEIIAQSSRVLLGIVNDVLDLSKVESGQMQLEVVRLNLAELVAEVVTVFEPLARAKGLPLYLLTDPALAMHYLGDPTRLRQIVSNLLSNAIKFTQRGKVTVEVWSAPNAESGRQVLITVRDTGIGISDDVRDRLFTAFEQGETSIARRYGGTGLGLALCRRLCDLMQGTISLTRTSCAGSNFAIELPLQAVQTATDHHHGEIQNARVALVCASADWRDAIIPHLRVWGLDVSLAEWPRDAPAHIPLILFGALRPWDKSEEEAAIAQSPFCVDAQEDGPCAPVASGSRVLVSCYSLDGLRKGIAQGPFNLDVSGDIASSRNIEPVTQTGLRVLVAEDNPVSGVLLRDQLEAIGCLADVAADGLIALDLFDKHEYRLVFTDLSMPHMGGLELAAQLRRRAPDVPIIAITASIEPEGHQACRRAGIDAVLLKPATLEDLRELIVGYVELDQAKAVPYADAAIAHESLPSELRSAMRTLSERSLACMDDAMAQGDMGTVLRHLHLIKGGFAMIRDFEVVAVCGDLEQRGRAGQSGMELGLNALVQLVHSRLQGDQSL
ncbi:hybrid sensor histidine kinase/response regulator [Burkholderia pyrrocinia]|uniref:histidine kinase n=1 Tax=Burkholderia pyrrocinia TaxID=60550 RepID=A0ABZ3BTV7_BURPY